MQNTRKNAVSIKNLNEQLQYRCPTSETPRFPSLEIKVNQMSHSSQNDKKREKKEEKIKSLWFSFQKPKGSSLFQRESPKNKNKNNNLRLDDHMSVGHFLQNRSVQSQQNKSTQSLNELKQKWANRSVQKRKIMQIKKFAKINSANSLSNLLAAPFGSPPTRKSLQANTIKKKIGIQPKYAFSSTKNKKMQRQYFISKTERANNSTKKIIKDEQAISDINVGSSQPVPNKQLDKASNPTDIKRPLKSLLYKSKPMLHLKGRILTNSKIETFTKPFDEFQQYI